MKLICIFAIVFIFFLVPITASDEQEQKFKQHMQNYCNSVIEYNKAVDESMQAWKEFLDGLASIPEGVQATHGRYAKFLAQAKKLDVNLPIKLGDFDKYSPEMASQAAANRKLLRLEEGQLQDLLGDLQELQRLMVSEENENDINGLIIQINIRFKMNLQGYSLARVHQQTDLVKTMLRERMVPGHSENDVIGLFTSMKQISPLQFSENLFVDQNIGDIQIESIVEKLPKLIDQEQQLFLAIEESIEDYQNFFHKNLKSSLEKSQIKISLRLQKVVEAYQTLKDDIALLDNLAEVESNRERASILKDEMLIFLQDVGEQKLEEQQERNNEFTQKAPVEIFERLKQELLLNNNQWQQFRSPFATAFSDLQNITLPKEIFPVERVPPGILQNRNTVNKNQAAFHVLRSLSSDVYYNFVMGMLKDFGETHETINNKLEIIVAPHPQILPVPPFIGFIAKNRPNNVLQGIDTDESVTKVVFFNKVEGLGAIKSQYDYTQSNIVKEILGINYEMGFCGVSDRNNNIKLRIISGLEGETLLQRDVLDLRSETPKLTGHLATKGLVKQSYSVSFHESKTEIEKREAIVDGKPQIISVEVQKNVRKTLQVDNHLNVWNLTGILLEPTEDSNVLEVGREKFATLSSTITNAKTSIDGQKIQFKVMGIFEDASKRLILPLAEHHYTIETSDSQIARISKSEGIRVVTGTPGTAKITVRITEQLPHLKPAQIELKVEKISIDVVNNTSRLREAKGNIDDVFDVRIDVSGQLQNKTIVNWLSPDFFEREETSLAQVSSKEWRMPLSSNLILLQIKYAPNLIITAQVEVEQLSTDGRPINRIAQKNALEELFTMISPLKSPLAIPIRHFDLQMFHQGGALFATPGEPLDLQVRLVLTYDLPLREDDHIVVEWPGFPNTRVPVTDEHPSLVNNFRVAWKSEQTNGTFSPAISSFQQNANREWIASTRWNVPEELTSQALASVVVELLGNKSDIDFLAEEDQFVKIPQEIDTNNEAILAKQQESVIRLQQLLQSSQDQNNLLRQQQKLEEEELQRAIAEEIQRIDAIIAQLEAETKKQELEEERLRESDEKIREAEEQIAIISDPRRAAHEQKREIASRLGIFIEAFDPEIHNQPLDTNEKVLKTMLDSNPMTLIDKAFPLLINDLNEFFANLTIRAITQAVIDAFKEGDVIEILSLLVAQLKGIRKLKKALDRIEEVLDFVREAQDKIVATQQFIENANSFIDQAQSGEFLDLINTDGVANLIDKKKKTKPASKTTNNKTKKPEDEKVTLDDDKKKNLSLKTIFKEVTKKLDGLKGKFSTKKKELQQKIGDIQVQKAQRKQQIEDLKDKKASVGCFTGDTLIHTEAGTKYIKDVTVDDIILAANVATRKFERKKCRVVEVYKRTVNCIYKLRFSKNTIKTTKEHPFWVSGQGWLAVQFLKVGDIVRTISGQELVLESIDIEYGKTEVYNLNVADLHNYFVGDVGILVHNNNRCNRGNKGDLNKENKKSVSVDRQDFERIRFPRQLGDNVKEGRIFKLTPDELLFVKKLLDKKNGIQIFRTNQKKRLGDFLLINRSNKNDPIGFVVDVKQGDGGAGNQLTNAQKAGIIFKCKIKTFSGSGDAIVDFVSQKRSTFDK